MLDEALTPDSRDELFKSLYTIYSPILRRFFRRVAPDARDDLVQETMFRLFMTLNDFRGESSFNTYIFKIARNILRNHLRDSTALKRSGTEISIDADPPQILATLAHEAQIERTVMGREQVELLEKAVARLPRRMRQVLGLRFGKGLSYREIASSLQISVDTVKVQVHQARRKLLKELGEGEPA